MGTCFRITHQRPSYGQHGAFYGRSRNPRNANTAPGEGSGVEEEQTKTPAPIRAPSCFRTGRAGNLFRERGVGEHHRVVITAGPARDLDNSIPSGIRVGKTKPRR